MFPCRQGRLSLSTHTMVLALKFPVQPATCRLGMSLPQSPAKNCMAAVQQSNTITRHKSHFLLAAFLPLSTGYFISMWPNVVERQVRNHWSRLDENALKVSQGVTIGTTSFDFGVTDGWMDEKSTTRNRKEPNDRERDVTTSCLARL